MTVFYNKPVLKDRRRELRHNLTNAERKLWSRLRSKQLFGLKFRRQFSVGPYILDFYCPSLRTAIELDGGHHLKRRTYDEQRDAFLKSDHIRVLRFWNREIMEDLEGIISQIVNELGI